MKTDVLLIGIDDTDTLESTGTGRMARDLADYLISLGMGASLGVSRHQLLVDDRIPYTSHNSSLCIGLKTDIPPKDFYEPSMGFLKKNFREGSDPGLCICSPDQITDHIKDFGLRAQKEVLNKNQADSLAAEFGIFLVELGGTGDGIIGSLAGVGLRVEGNSGRYIDLPGIRDIKGIVTVSELLARTDIESVINIRGDILDRDAVIDSRDWMRPSLVNGQPVLRVRPRLSTCDDTAWTSAELREREKRELREVFGNL
jgi:hypothetical protein